MRTEWNHLLLSFANINFTKYDRNISFYKILYF